MPLFSPYPIDAWLPPDNGLLAAVSDPAVVSGNFGTTAGTVYLSKLIARSAITITNIWLGLVTAGTGASTGSFVGLYSSAGTLLSGSSDIASSLTGTTGGISNALTTPQSVAAGAFVWVALLTNLASTQPTVGRGAAMGASTTANMGLTAATYRFAINGTGLTSLPSSITPSSNGAPSGSDLWVGVS